MGKRGPKPQPDWLKRLRGNPGQHRLNPEEPPPIPAGLVVIADDPNSPLGWLSRAGGPEAAAKAKARAARMRKLAGG